jgi:LAO/AO transport system kinase
VDVLAINKADGDNAGPARLASASYKSALRLLRGRDVPVHVCSALEDEGVAEVWETLQALWVRDEADGSLAARRGRQTVAWMWRLVDERLRSQVRRADRAELVEDVVRRVADGTTSASAGATEVLRSFQAPD